MQTENTLMREMLSKDLMNVLIRVGLIAILVVMSVKILSPFMGIMMWALILAVTLYPVHQKLANKLGGKQGRAATLLVLCGVLLIGGPTIILGSSAAGFIYETHAAFENDTITIKAPPSSVAEWPVVGNIIHETWTKAANDLPALLQKNKQQLLSLSKAILGYVAGTAGGIFSFILSVIISGIMMAYGRSGSEAMRKISYRLSGPEKGDNLFKLSTATIRSVSMGVIGVAFIQSLLIGVGLFWADVPAAGLLAGAVLVLGIAQLPATLITLPVIAYIWWSGDSTLSNVIFTVYLIVAGLADNVLKPMFLGRGVDAPMPIILLGALGGMVTGGLIGLFVGSVLLALGYVIFMDWVDDGEIGTSFKAVEATDDDVSACD